MKYFEFFTTNYIRTAFDCKAVPKRFTICTSICNNITTQVDRTLGLVRIKTNDQELLTQYLKKVKSQLSLDIWSRKLIVDVQQTDVVSSQFLYTGMSSIRVPLSTIRRQPQYFLHAERAVTKLDSIFEKNPLDVLEPFWDGTAFSIDPYVARDIINRIYKDLDVLTDCVYQFSKSLHSGSPRENHFLVESARLFSVVLEPGWLQRIADAQVLDQSLASYNFIAESPQSGNFEYRTLEHSKHLYRKTKVSH